MKRILESFCGKGESFLGLGNEMAVVMVFAAGFIDAKREVCRGSCEEKPI